MNISEKNFNKIYNFLLFAIATTMLFRKVCTIIIIVFAVFNLLFFKKLKRTNSAIILGVVIASPLLLELLFFWNNDSLTLGLKSIEKSISLVVFPLFILGHFQRIAFNKLLRYYSVATTAIVLFFFVRFIVLYPDLMNKYLKGTDLWEMGYSFANSIGIHAPALNMHLAFVVIIHFYYTITAFKINATLLDKGSRLFLFMLSFFFVLFVNTRVALINVLLCVAVVFFFEIANKYSFKKSIKIFLATTALVGGIFFLFVQSNPYMSEKYSKVTFAYMDKIGKLDEIENPESTIFNALVTRLSIWKSTWELSVKKLPFGTGASDGKPELFKYYKQTNQHFLSKYEFPVHNQFLDFLLKFGILGPVVVLLYIGGIGFLGMDLKNAVVFSFFLIFLMSNLTDDFLLRFDGIAFSGFWFSIFGSYWLQQKKLAVIKSK
ncbi:MULTISPECIES: O-antigen ligase family protein [unclassified Flavobacterium]|uniref:O-antigen ligase family protein n=1 Tax=unclassified Flavobacterium TaxID=196869 RepID=UPI003F90086B